MCQIQPKKTSGYLELEHATVKWFLSINRDDLPIIAIENKKPTFRSITIDGYEIEFSEGFTDLHTVLYQNILDGKGFGIEDARASIELAHQIRNVVPIGKTGNSHNYL